jgi:cytochrome b6-f complex iron-sulfur subunit
MDRRTFVTLAGIGALVTALEILAKANAIEPGHADSLTVAQATGFQAVGSLNQLTTAQDQIQARVGNRSVVVIRDPANTSNILAFDRSCPHEGCWVDWSGSQSQFVCPCHSGLFNAQGQVIQGPPRSPLTSYPVRLNGNTIMVQVG